MSKFSIDNFQNEFPVEVLPESLQRYTREAYENLKFQPSFVGLSILTAIGFAIGGKRWMSVRNTWKVSPHIWGIIIGHPSDGKTPPIDVVIKPIMDRHNVLMAKNAIAIEKYEDELEFYTNLTRAQKVATKKPKMPVETRLVVTDVTFEAINREFKPNPHGLLNSPNEAMAFFNSMSRYQANDRAGWINVFDRKQNENLRSSRKLSVKNPFMSLISTIQFDAFNKFMKTQDLNDGLPERFLFAMSTAKGPKKRDKGEISQQSEEELAKIINRLLDYSASMPEGDQEIIPMTQEFKDAFDEWEYNTQKIYFDDGARASINQKLTAHTLTFAFILCHLHEENPTEVGIKYFHMAIKLYFYFRDTAFKAISLMEGINPLKNLTKNEQAALNAMPERVSTKQAKEILQQYNVKPGRWRRLRENNDLFEKAMHGLYEKVY